MLQPLSGLAAGHTVALQRPMTLSPRLARKSTRSWLPSSSTKKNRLVFENATLRLGFSSSVLSGVNILYESYILSISDSTSSEMYPVARLAGRVIALGPKV